MNETEDITGEESSDSDESVSESGLADEVNEAEDITEEESSDSDESVSESGLADEVNEAEDITDKSEDSAKETDIDGKETLDSSTQEEKDNNVDKDSRGNVDDKEDTDGIDAKSEIFDNETGRFNTGFFGEMPYDSKAMEQETYITKGMMNDDSSKATQSFSSNLRASIQENAIEARLNEDSDYFRQFGCDKETSSAIRAWFSQSKEYTLHETKEHTVQIMDAKIHRSVHHDGGVSQEKSDMISADSKKDNSLNYEDNLWWMKK